MSLFVALITILAVMIFSHQPNYVNSLVEVSLILTTDDPNGTHPCDLSGSLNSTVQNITIWGSTTVDCSVNVTLLSNGRMYLEVIDGQMVGTDYLYVERLGYEGVCKRFVAYTNSSNRDALCSMSFSQSNLTIQFRGNIALQLTELSSLSNAELRETDCETIIEVGTHKGQMSSCQRAKGYNQVITCGYRVRDEIWDYLSGWAYDTKCDAPCPLNCNCTVEDSEVIQECLNEHKITKQSSTMIFPTNVSNLNLSHNSLSTFDSATFVAIGDMIERLDLGFNKLSLEVGMFQNLVNLLELGLTDNGLTDIPRGVFSDLKSLKQLWLYRNSLTVLEDGVFDGLEDLEMLVLWGNELSFIQVGLLANLTRLRKLYLYSNKLSVLEAGVFDGLGDLEILDLEDNELSSIQVGLLANLTRLRELWLNRNKLSVLEAGVFDGLGDLEILVLRDNELSSIQVGLLANLTRLRELWLDRNKLSVLEAGVFDGLGDLEILALYDNELSSIQVGSLADLTRLRELWLYSNKLSVLEDGVFEGLGDLKKLVLWGNKLSIIQTRTFQGLSQLIYLSLRSNKLVHLNMTGSVKMCFLQRFAVNNNTLTKLLPDTFQCMTTLEYLLLDQNKLTYLDSKIFHGLNSLRELVLADNFIHSLPYTIFKDLQNLNLLDLKNNRLHKLPKIYHMTNLKEMKITGNPLKWITSQTFDNLTSVQIYVDQPEVCLCYASNITKCTYALPLSGYLTCERLLAENAGMIIMFVLGFCATFGNAGVLFKKLIEKRENKVQSLLICNLAMSDLLMGIYMIIIASADVYYGNYFPINSETWRKSNLCRSAGAIAIISTEASVIFITLLSIDRCIGIRYPYTLHKLRVKSTCLTALVTWIFTIIIGVIASALAGVNVDFYDNSHVCIGLPFVQTVDYKYQERNISSSRWYERLEGNFAAVDTVRSAISKGQSPGLYFSVALFLGFNLLCMLIIIFCYVLLVKTVSETSEDVGRSREMKEQIKLTARVTAIVMTDVCCWLPIILMGILVQSGAVELEAKVYAWTVMFVLPFNSTINPLLYTYRTVIYEHWKKWRNRRKTRANQRMEMKRIRNQQEDVQEQRIKGYSVDEQEVECQDVEFEGQNIMKIETQHVRSQDIQKQQVENQAFEEELVIVEGQDIGKRKVKEQDVEKRHVTGQESEERDVVVERETSFEFKRPLSRKLNS